MIETILITALSATLSLKTPTICSKAPATPVALARVLPEKNLVSCTVEKEDTLSTISEKYYGTEDYSATLWNDNSWITDPENLEEGRVLTIRATKPVIPEVLNVELAEKEELLVAKKNEEYLESIGYPKVKPEVVVASTPSKTEPEVIKQVVVQTTPAPVAQSSTPSNNPSVISEEAITYLGNCEAGMDPAKNTGNGYYGAFQFSASTWKSMNTGYERADLAPIEVQKAAVQQLLQRSSIYSQFPGCANKMRSAKII